MQNCFFINLCDYFGSNAGALLRFLNYNSTVGLLHRSNNGIDVNRANRTQIDNFSLDAFLLKLIGGFGGSMYHQTVRDNCYI
ncbi:hypothetical protein D3C87_2023360 [compost metagenome]